jgi:hypothetical protein
MTAPELTLFCLVSFLFLCVGVVGGWGLKSYLDNMLPSRLGVLHQEFFDEDGNVIADEVVSLRLESGFLEEFQEEYRGLFDEDDDDDDDDDDDEK